MCGAIRSVIYTRSLISIMNPNLSVVFSILATTLFLSKDYQKQFIHQKGRKYYIS